MTNEKQIRIIGIAHNSAIAILLIIGILLFIFSLISGSETYGGGLTGLTKNSANSIPWIILLVLVIIARKNYAWGGFLLLIFGGMITYYFNFRGGNFFISTFIFCLTVVFLSLVILFTGAAISKYNKDNELL
ncbi:hypothetical protein C5O00_04465 [Pukyongia salina]|uniref:Uncharacterized protein n=1 Tax=Pukyongia salina TaxID=2094025 RepID=A0A2S0HUV2_9FLAO|nr:hypothetical protein [Pukyongia salina]AVI50457.1 hypothetical protein C5O00_04465 [Pukyongia salina]